MICRRPLVPPLLLALLAARPASAETAAAPAPVAAPAASPAPAPAAGGASAPASGAPDERAARLAALEREADELYLRRDQKGAIEKLEQTFAALEALERERYETLWRRARLAFWQSDVARTDEEKARLGKLGWDLAERALRVRAGGIEARYYLGICAGNYGDGIGVAKALFDGVERPFVDNLEAVWKRQPGFDDGGAQVALGRFHFKLPWPRRDYDRSAAMLREVVERFPTKLRARLYLAETLLADDRAAEARKLLEQLEAAPVGRDAPEDRLVKRWAGELRPRVEAALR